MPSSDTQFQGKGAGTKHGESPISIRFSSKVRAALKDMPNAQDYVRQAVEEKLWVDSLPSVAIELKSQLPKESSCDERVKEAISYLVPRIAIRDRAASIRAFKKLVTRLAESAL